LLSDIDSQVIRRYGILNDQIGRGGAFLEGIPFPGAYVTNEAGVVIAKFFHDTYKKRDSPENLLDAAAGTIQINGDEPNVRNSNPELPVSVFVRGGRGTVRQGIIRHLVVRFELPDGLHIYGEPVPNGMVPTTVNVSGPTGLVFEDPIFPAPEALVLKSTNIQLRVWSGRVDVVIPFYAVGSLASETRPLDHDTAKIDVELGYQACDDSICLPPQTDSLSLRLKLDVVDVPALGIHTGHGQREGNFSATRHMRRLILRKFLKNPFGLPRLALKIMRLERAARRRAHQA